MSKVLLQKVVGGRQGVLAHQLDDLVQAGLLLEDGHGPTPGFQELLAQVLVKPGL